MARDTTFPGMVRHARHPVNQMPAQIEAGCLTRQSAGRFSTRSLRSAANGNEYLAGIFLITASFEGEIADRIKQLTAPRAGTATFILTNRRWRHPGRLPGGSGPRCRADCETGEGLRRRGATVGRCTWLQNWLQNPSKLAKTLRQASPRQGSVSSSKSNSLRILGAPSQRTVRVS